MLQAKVHLFANAVRCGGVLLALSLLAACGDDAPPPIVDDRFLTTLRTPEDYAQLAGEGDELKYLVVAPGASAPVELAGPCIFQDTERFAFHVHFLRTFDAYATLDFEAYMALVLRRDSRVFWGGTLKLWSNTLHPLTQQRGVISYALYTEEGAHENPTVDEVAELHQQLSTCMAYASELLVYVPDGVDQTTWARAQRQALLDRDVPVVMPDELRAGLGAEVYSEGESYGYLRVVPQDQALGDDYSPREVLIVQSAPNDIGIVSGLISANPQSLHSHVNLRLREKQTPNASVPDAYDNALIASLDGQLVHVIARDEDVMIGPATLADAQAFWDAHRPTLPALQSDLSVVTLTSFDTLTHDDALAYGTKAANLGELHGVLPAAHRVEGFGIPFSAYAALIEDNDLASLIDGVLDDAAATSDRALLDQRLDQLRDAIKDATISQLWVERVQDAIEATFGAQGATTRLRFRSSTNAEDLEALSGAGLYDSKSGCLADDQDADDAGPSLCLSEADAAYYNAELTRVQSELAAHPDRTWLSARIEDLQQELSEEKSALGALKKVWASLWTLRAFEERAYYGIDHRDVYMGIAVNPSFVGERLDAVVVTNLPSAGQPAIWRVVTQVAEVGVVRPDDPTAVPETLTFERGETSGASNVQVLVSSSFASAAGESLWTAAQLDTLAELLFDVQDHFEMHAYPDTRPLSLDLEVKLTRDEQISIKQARPYRLSTP